MPPSWMWHLDEELADHFEWVIQDQGGDDDEDTGDDRDDDDAPRRTKPHKSVPMQRNEFAEGRGADS